MFKIVLKISEDADFKTYFKKFSFIYKYSIYLFILYIINDNDDQVNTHALPPMESGVQRLPLSWSKLRVGCHHHGDIDDDDDHDLVSILL